MYLLHEAFVAVVATLTHITLKAVLATAAQLVVVACGLAGNILINRKDARGFYLWLISNGLLVVLQLVTGMYLLMLLYVAYFILSAQGLRRWRAPSTQTL
jgi:nicotinamide riboside transporter PnuC